MKIPDPNKSSRRGVVLCGAYGMGNAGDDAVLSAIIAALRQLDPELPVAVMARRPRETARRFGVRAIHPLDIPRWLAAMGRARLFLSGGGTLLQDVTSRRSLFYYLAAIRLARRRGCSVQLYGCGAGPLERPGSRTLTARVINRCADAVTLRDRDSMTLLASIGVDPALMRLAADPALSLPAVSAPREQAVGIILRDWPGLGAHMDAMAAAAARVRAVYGLTPELFCFAPEDRAPAQALRELLAERGVPCAIAGDLSRTGAMSLILSMRLHGLIFALRDGVPAAGISYDPKVSSFCGEAGLPCLPLEAAETDALCRLADDALQLDRDAMARSAAELRRRGAVSARTAASFLFP